MLTTQLIHALALGAVASSPPDASASGDQAIQELKAQIASLQNQVSDLRKTSGEDWLTEQRAEEIRSMVHDVLADADTRASLLAQGVSAGHDGHFFLASPDGNFRLEIAGQMQVRYVYNLLEEAPGIDTNRAGFEIRRMKLDFSGHIIDPSWQYTVVGAFDRDGGALEAEDVFINKSFDNGVSVQVGQFKLPFMREELVSSKRQLAVDRSLVNEEFNQDRSQGAQVTYEGDQFKFDVAASDGFASSNVAALTEDIEGVALTGRAEWLAMGDWRQFRDFTSPQGSEQGLLVGAAIHYEKAEYGTASGPEEELFTWTADVSFEGDGFNVFAALVGRNLDVADTDEIGIVIQGGLYLTSDIELYARYEWADPDDDAIEELSALTFGVNKYFDKHNLKWTSDIGIGFNEVDSKYASSGVGWRTDGADEDGQVSIRTQLQLLF